MQTEYIRAGSVDQIIPVRIIDTSTLQATDNTAGRGLTGLVWNTSGLTCYYFRENGGNNNSIQMALANYTRGGTHTDGGFAEQDPTNQPGDYWLCLKDEIVAAGAGWAQIILKGASNMLQTAIRIVIIDEPSIVYGVVDTGSTQTVIKTSSLSPAVTATDQFKGRIMIFDKNTTTANMRGQAARIGAINTGGDITVLSGDDFTQAPAAGDTFRIF